MKELVSSRLPSDWGEYSICAFGSEGDEFPHVVLHKGLDACLQSGTPLPVRVHSECMTGDVFASNRCDCGGQLQAAMAHFQSHGGMLIYLRQEGRGIGLVEKLRAYNLQDEGLNTFEANEARGHQADLRDYGSAVSILAHFGVARITLLTNNPEKERAMLEGGIEVVEVLPLVQPETPDNSAYIAAKRLITGHRL